MSSDRCKALLSWYALHARKLPWRETTDPYHIWISEIMLQQTQVKTVLPRYLGWFEAFPTIEALASASADDVLKAWEGLGYYRRARFIHRSAQMIQSDYDGRFPNEFDDIMKLSGIGRSTAGAISSFCFSTFTAVLDGNVKRVLKRWYAKPETGDKELWLLAQQAIETADDPAIWNQAMMELGATVCSAKSPSCEQCPVQHHCASAFHVDISKEIRKPVAVLDVHWRIHLFICPEKGIWLSQRPDSGIWAGLWTPPITELEECPEQEPAHIHQLTHRRLHLYPDQSETEPRGDGRWVPSIEGYALPTGIHHLLEKVI
ncbi:A/G-specific adenine glycosylase [Mariprofundus micogutta]|uniref:Adenine DNA glycosylase n=1 Tax=Mariprofundus micogutta TaxID=1921010 RepID=A0A1L8CLE7_9PROT|nr:A/G-specific adenine glycosylase [Mariprofundus micogutta]GAV19669.1 A/G-specific adenine glycosylase [Mariprofundus micogutta]